METANISYDERAMVAERVDTCPLDAFYGAAGLLSREWGDYGYRIGYAGQYGTPTHPYLFPCSHSDGSRFAIVADRYGNAQAVRDSVTATGIGG